MAHKITIFFFFYKLWTRSGVAYYSVITSLNAPDNCSCTFVRNGLQPHSYFPSEPVVELIVSTCAPYLEHANTALTKE